MSEAKPSVYWKVAYWMLLPLWILGAGLSMAKVKGGIFTNYLADLTFPPYYYIVIRGLWNDTRKIPVLLQWFGQSAERAAASIFVSGILYEFSQLYWPKGLFAGTCDPWDVAVYLVGLVVCYYYDSKGKY